LKTLREMSSQFHPEFRSWPNRAHPLFAGPVEAATERREGKVPELLAAAG